MSENGAYMGMPPTSHLDKDNDGQSLDFGDTAEPPDFQTKSKRLGARGKPMTMNCLVLCLKDWD